MRVNRHTIIVSAELIDCQVKSEGHFAWVCPYCDIELKIILRAGKGCMPIVNFVAQCEDKELANQL